MTAEQAGCDLISTVDDWCRSVPDCPAQRRIERELLLARAENRQGQGFAL